jgi:hypothetical protein
MAHPFHPVYPNCVMKTVCDWQLPHTGAGQCCLLLFVITLFLLDDDGANWLSSEFGGVEL